MDSKDDDMKQDNLHRVLMVCTNTSDSSWGAKTGLWFEELSTPYYIFSEAGFEVDIVSITGQEIAVDPACWTTEYNAPESQDKFLSDDVARNKFQNASSIEDVLTKNEIKQYGCIFLCGGHGCIDDFYMNAAVHQAVEYIHNKTKGAVGSVCHGCIGLIGCKLENGNSLLNGKFVAVFSNEEEGTLNLQGVIPRQCEDLVDAAGAICVPQAPWKPNAVVDGRLATGQNPASSLEATQRCLDILRSLGAKFSPLQNENKPWGK